VILMGFDVLHSAQEAISLLERSELRPKTVLIDLDESLGRISADTVVSPEDIPPHDRSVLDGYAARWSDISMASENSPTILTLVGEVPIDRENPGKIDPGETVKVATGSLIPEGANVVIPKEYVEVENNKVKVFKAFAGGYGISVQGEDLRKGDIVIKKGYVIREWHLALLASLGFSKVKVYDSFKVAVFATGDELIEPGTPKKVGKVYVSTARLIISWLKNRGIEAKYFGIVPDNEEKIEKKFETLLNSYEIVVSTGGTSVGERDLTAKALKKISEDYVHGLALSPGKPAAFGIANGKILMALSGMPVAALSELIAVFDPYYRSILGRKEPWEPVFMAEMGRKYTSHPGFTNVVRSILCHDNSRLKVYPLRVTGSGILSTLIKANSYFIVEEEITGIEEGEKISVRLINEEIKRCQENVV